MDPKYRKFKQQESKSHEKLLKVILQIYKPYLRRGLKKPVAEELSENDTSEDNEEFEPVRSKNYSACKVKVDNETLEKQRKEEQGKKILGDSNPSLLSMYVNGEITLSQLKQNYYSQCKKIDYVCYDNLKSQLNLPEKSISSPNRTRECHQSYSKKEVNFRSRPKSASWNYNTKVNHLSSFSVLANDKGNNDKELQKASSVYSKRKWNSSIKASQNLISDPCRLINVTNDRKERPKSSIRHGGRLSAKAMHDIMVETIFPVKKEEKKEKAVPTEVRLAMRKAAERASSYKRKPHSHSITSMIRSHHKQSSVKAEVRDIIYLY